MLIDETYFIGPLKIAQLGQKAVVDGLKDIINRFEPVILEAALGYDFYQAFLDGLNAGSDEAADQRWLDLLNGTSFKNVQGVKKKFAGFAGGSNTQTVIASERDDLFIYAGTTPGFPVGGFSYTDPDLKGWNFTVEFWGVGTIQPVAEWNYKTGGGITLTNTGYTTTPGERWVIHFTGKKIGVIQSSVPNQFSPLAGFIFYEYMKDLSSQNTGVGFVKSVAENSVPANPVRKPVDAFNEAARQIHILWEFLEVDNQAETKVYPEFDPGQVPNFNWYNRWYGARNYVATSIYYFNIKNTFGI